MVARVAHTSAEQRLPHLSRIVRWTPRKRDARSHVIRPLEAQRWDTDLFQRCRGLTCNFRPDQCDTPQPAVAREDFGVKSRRLSQCQLRRTVQRRRFVTQRDLKKLRMDGWMPRMRSAAVRARAAQAHNDVCRERLAAEVDRYDDLEQEID